MKYLGIQRGSFLLIFLVFVLAAATIPAYGQAVYGTIIGTVTDPTGAAVANAKVSITNVGTNVSTDTTTNDSGNYIQTQLLPGNYKVTVTNPGFNTFVQQNVGVIVGQSTRVDAALQVGEVTQEVTVSEAPPGLQTDRAEMDTTISAGQLTQLPVLNRNFTNLTLLVPGATLNTFQHAASENPQQSTLVNTNGQEFAGTNYLLDGMNNNDAVLGIVMVNPPLDSVGETSIATSNYQPEYTSAGGAVVRIETKSGTNDLHGSAYDFLQNNVFEARDPFTQGLHDPGTPAPPNRGVPELRWNQFGASLGGPAIKDKLFWFGNYEGTRRRLGASQTLRVPTMAERGGDLSALGVPIYDPTTGNPDGTGRTAFPGGVIPSTMINPAAAKLLAALPAPNLTPANPADNNYDTSAVERFNTDQFVIRVDHYLSDKLRWFAKYNYLGADINAPGPFGLYGGPQFNWGFTGASNARNQSFVAAANYNFNPTLLADIRFGYSRYRVNVTPLDIGQQLANTVGIPGLNFADRKDTWGLPDINVNGAGGFQMGYRCNCPLDEREFIYDGVANFTKIQGNHQFRFGGTFELAGNRRLPSDQHRAGVYDFDPAVTTIASGTGGLGLASFLLGAPDQFQRFAQVSTTQEDRQNRMFYFVQDTWRITSKLTLNYGLRWDTWFPDYSLNAGQGGRYDVTTNIVYIPGAGGISKSGNAQTQWHNISPRIGIAYALNPKTVVRAGYGRTYYPGTFGWTFNNLAADVYPSVVTQQIVPTSKFLPVFSLTSAPPAVVFPAIPSNGMLPLTDGIGVSYIPANQKIPSVDQWNFTIERQMPWQVNLSAGYVGNVGRHLNGGFDLNAPIPGPGPLTSRQPLFLAYGLTQGIFDKCNCSSSNYNSLQVRGEKRFSSSYSLLASYTFSKALDFGEFGTPFYQYNARLNYGPADFDRTHVFTLAHTLVLPFGPGHKYMSSATGWVRGLVSGWQFSGITTVESGIPFTATLANNASLNSTMTLLPDVIGNPTSGFDQNRNQWYNTAAFGVPALYTPGNEARNSLRGPGLLELDWSLSKTFAIRERFQLQARWEVFNVINHTNLGLPSNGNNPQADNPASAVITDIASGATMRNMQLGLRLSW